MEPDEDAQNETNRNRNHSQHAVPAVRKAEIGDAHGNDRHPQEHAHKHPRDGSPYR